MRSNSIRDRSLQCFGLTGNFDFTTRNEKPIQGVLSTAKFGYEFLLIEAQPFSIQDRHIARIGDLDGGLMASHNGREFMNAEQSLTRRTFIQTSVAAVAGSTLLPSDAFANHMAQEKADGEAGSRPVVISSANGFNRPKGQSESCIERAMQKLKDGVDPLVAVIAGVNVVEDDPEDTSVGLGGLPNEDGIVELDSSVMDGPSRRAGAVASLRNIRNPSLVAEQVMRRTDHVLIVGEGALRFAKAMGFKEENLLTDETREEWLKWKLSHSQRDDWLGPEEFETEKSSRSVKRWKETYGTINCCAVDAKGNIGGVTTTSGLAYKIPGRVGDSPIIGAGLYVDNDVGAAGSTGRGESNLVNCSSFMIVEMMRNNKGMSPQRACETAIERIVKRSEPRLLDSKNRPKFDLKFYAIAKDGRYGSASIWSGAKFAVNDEKGARLEECSSMFDKKLQSDE